MEFHESKVLHCSNNLISKEIAFKNTKIIAYLFTAASSTRSKPLLAKLKTIYRKGKEINAHFEVVYVPFDNDEDTMIRHFLDRHGSWFALVISDPTIWILKSIYNVTSLPTVIVVTPAGEMITRLGVKEIETLGIDVLVAWSRKTPT